MRTTNKKSSFLSKRSDRVLKAIRYLYLILGIFLIVGGILLVLISPTNCIFILIGIWEIYYSNKCKQELTERKNKNLSTNDATEPIFNPENTTVNSISDLGNPTIHAGTNSEKHNIAGTPFKQKEIKSLGFNNTDYSLTKKEIIECGLEDEKIYKTIFSPTDIQLIEEPENEHDPNAIKVIIDNVHVGYIKRGSCSHIKKLINQNKILSISADIHGGKYKRVSSYYDADKDKETFDLESGETDFFVSIYLDLI